MNQLLLGAAFPFAVGLILYVRRRARASLRLLTVVPAAMAAGALWAVAPDIPRLLGWSGLYLRLARSPWTDIFLFHYTIDRLESDSPLFGLGLVLMAAALSAAAWREMALRETD
ncbi:MAG: hypothetical protein JW951_10495 [Lentisphaerae bacterium]|nr:hypothetical protein [Lentisphaerota bacterium]